ncbi:hypothetical protein D9M69_347520 [compost metagenome]
MQQLIELLGVVAQLALQGALAELQAEHGTTQGEQGGKGQQQGREGRLGGGRAGCEAELPVWIAAFQGDRCGAGGLAALGQYLGRGVAELLDQLQLADIRRQLRQAAQQALEVEHQQQGALGGALLVQAQRRDAVDQPALAYLVRFGAGLLAAFQATQQVQRGEVHRCRPLAVLLGLAGQVEVRVDHAVAVAQAALGGGQLAGVAAVEGIDQPGIVGGRGSVGLQLGEGLAQAGGLAAAPGLAELLDPALVCGMDRPEPEQGTGGSQATQGGEHAGEQVIRALGARAGGARPAGRTVGGGILAAALEEFH